MKTICCSVTFYLTLMLNAQSPGDKISNTSSVLIAQKQSKVLYFRLSTPVRILFKNAQGQYQLSKGNITHFKNDSLIIESFTQKDKAVVNTISPNAIEKIRLLSRRGRKTAAIILSGGAAYAGVMGIISKPGPLQYVLFIPAIGAALFFTYFYPVTFLVDLARQKSKKNGWHFYIKKVVKENNLSGMLK